MLLKGEREINIFVDRKRNAIDWFALYWFDDKDVFISSRSATATFSQALKIRLTGAEWNY